GERYFELRFGFVVHKPRLILSDQKVIDYWQASGIEKKEELSALLEKTQLLHSFDAYYQGLEKFRREQPDFRFGMLGIIDKSFSPIFSQWIAEMVLELKSAGRSQALKGSDTAGMES